MCLVEIEKFPKPVASCAMPLADNMVIYVDTPLVLKARESVLEYLLINHPLDCPICDQGGECDLQDQTMKYGSDQSRFFGTYKRGVEDKNFGLLVKTVMTRCIHCTRCVRYADEIAGVGRLGPDGTVGTGEKYSLGTSGRGVNVEIGFYIDKIFHSELSGNVIDLCPVGALTSKPQAFKYRSWELENYGTIDINDSLGIPIQVDLNLKENKIIRIKPNQDPSLSDTWISDKTRYFFDGLNYQNLYDSSEIKPNSFNFLKTKTIEEKQVKNFESVSFSSWWDIIFFLFLTTKKITKKNFTRHLTGSHVSIETLDTLQKLSALEGSYVSIESLVSTNICTDFETNYKCINVMDSIDSADVVLLVSSNLRYDLPNLNIKLKNIKQKKNAKIAYIGTFYENTYQMDHLGASLETFYKIIQGKHKYSIFLKKAKNPKILIGSLSNLNETSTTFSSNSFSEDLRKILNIKLSQLIINYQTLPTLKQEFSPNPIKNNKKEIYNLFSFLPTDISSVGAMNLGIKKATPKRIFSNLEKIHFLNAEEMCSVDEFTFDNKKIIFQGHHITSYFSKKENSENLLMTLPNKTPFEIQETFLNLEGRQRVTKKIIQKNEDDEENSKSSQNPINTMKLKKIKENSLFYHANYFNQINQLLISQQYQIKNKKTKVSFLFCPFIELFNNNKPNRKNQKYQQFLSKKKKNQTKFLNFKLNTKIKNFFKTNNISKNSQILQKVSKLSSKLSLSNF